MKKVVDSDIYRMTGIKEKTLKRFFLSRFSHQIRYVCLLRKAKNSNSIFLKYKLFKYGKKFGLEISSKAQIGEGLYLGHAYNITVAAGAKIGKNCNLHKGCTIGRSNRGNKEGSPTLGDCVYVGTNSTIVGKVTIGNDVLIAPNAYVNFDVPSHSVVVGNPGVIHKKENATEKYIIHKI